MMGSTYIAPLNIFLFNIIIDANNQWKQAITMQIIVLLNATIFGNVLKYEIKYLRYMLKIGIVMSHYTYRSHAIINF